MLRLVLKLLLIFILVAFFNSGVLAASSFPFKWSKDQEPEQHQGKQKQMKEGPPSHASAHGFYRAKHKYQYYPFQKVYHDTERGLYFYLNGDNWEVGATLPSHLSAGLGDFVTIELETDKPYSHNDEHVKEYSSEKPRKAKNNIWSKLVFVLLYGHPSR